MRTSTQIAWNTASLWAARAVYAVLGLVLVPFLLVKLGKEGYGLIGVVGAVVGFSFITDLGLRDALGRHLAEQVARKDHQRFNELVSTGLLVYLLLGGASATICFLVATPLAGLFHVSQALRPQAVFLIRWLGSAMILVTFIRPAPGAILISNHRFDLNNLISIGVEILRATGILIVLSVTGSGLYGWAGAYLGAEVIGLIIRYFAAHRVQPGLQIRPRHVDFSAVRSLASLGGYLYVSQLSGTLAVRSDPIVLSVFFGPTAVALYAPARAMVNLVTPLVNSLSQQLHPLATTFHVTGRREHLQALLLRGTSYTMLMAIPVCVILCVFAEPIMRLWLERSLGPDHVIVAWVLVVMGAAAAFSFAQGSQRAVLLGMNRMRFFVLIDAIGAVLNLGASIVLVGFTGLGVVGVVIPTLIVAAVRRPIIAIYTARVAGLAARRYFLASYARPLLVLLATLALALGLRIGVSGESRASGLLCMGIVAIAWIPICWWVGFASEDRASFREMGQRIWARLSKQQVSRKPEQSVTEEIEVIESEGGRPSDTADWI